MTMFQQVNNMEDAERMLQRKDRIERGNREPSRLERIRMWFETGTELIPADEEWKDLMEAAYNLMLKGKSKTEVQNFLKEENPHINRRQIYEVISDALELFGVLNRGSKAGMRAVITDRMLRLAMIAEEKENVDLARKILHMVANLNGLHEDDEAKKEKRKVNIFRYSTDEAVLTQIEEERNG